MTAYRPDAAAALSDLIRREAYVRAVERARFAGRQKFSKVQYQQMAERLIENALKEAFKRMRNGDLT